jgi:hypothetical protein
LGRIRLAEWVRARRPVQTMPAGVLGLSWAGSWATCRRGEGEAGWADSGVDWVSPLDLKGKVIFLIF